MNENWAMAIAGVLLVVFGAFATAVSGAMPGSKPGYPPSLRFRLILISFGIVILGLGAFRLMGRP